MTIGPVSPSAARGEAGPDDDVFTDSGYEQDLESLRRLLESGDTEEARSFVHSLVSKWPDNPLVERLARVLAPPEVKARTGEPSRSLDIERQWLRRHAGQFPGQWVAVYKDQLVASGPDFQAVLAEVRRTPGKADALMHFQPGKPA